MCGDALKLEERETGEEASQTERGANPTGRPMNRAHIVAPPIVADIEVVEHVSFSAVEKFVRRSSLNCALNLGQSTYRWLTSKSRFTDESLPLKQITKTTPPLQRNTLL